MKEKLPKTKTLFAVIALSVALFALVAATCKTAQTANPEAETQTAAQTANPEADEAPPSPEPLPDLEMVFVEGGVFDFHGKQAEVGGFYISKNELSEKTAFSVEEWAVARGIQQKKYYFYTKLWENGIYPYDVRWYDALYFCNLLSLYQDCRPVYWLDPQLTVALDFNAVTEVPGYIRGNYETGEFEDYRLLDFYIDSTADGFRLPTEMEWEFAARGGNQSQGFVYAGSDILEEVATIGPGAFVDFAVGMETMDSGPANELGLYRMSGSLREWCIDYRSGEPLTDISLREGVYFFDANSLTKDRIIKGGFTEELVREYGSRVTDFLRPDARPWANLYRVRYGEGGMNGEITIGLEGGNASALRPVQRRQGIYGNGN